MAGETVGVGVGGVVEEKNEEESYIVATNQQTRFHIGATRRSAEVS